jgi:Uma2 family endonuclease
MATEPSTSPGRSSRASQRLLLRDVAWRSYEAVLNELRAQPIRITYDAGKLEFLELSDEHRMLVRLIGRLVTSLSQALGVRLTGGRPMTFLRRDLDGGLEPDRYYYLGDEVPGRGLREILPEYDRPPDLAVEIDLEGSALDRMRLYAAMGFPEVWRHDGQHLRVHLLRDDGRYTVGAMSRCLPFPRLTAALGLMRKSEALDDAGLVPSFSGWVRRERERALQERREARPAPGAP